MKKIIIMAFSLVSVFCYAQKVTTNKIENGVEFFATDYKDMKFADDVSYSLQLFTDGQQSEYFVVLCSEENKVHSFPEDAKLLLKTKKDETIELVSLFSSIVETAENEYQPTAYFPISERDLQATFDGIVKVRLEMLSIDKDGAVFTDVRDNKKDMGKDLKKMYEAIQKQIEKNKEIRAKDTKATERGGSISEDF